MKKKNEMVEEIITEMELPVTPREVKKIFESKEEAYGREVTKLWIRKVAEKMEGIEVEHMPYKGNVYNVIKKEGQDILSLSEGEKKKIVEE